MDFPDAYANLLSSSPGQQIMWVTRAIVTQLLLPKTMDLYVPILIFYLSSDLLAVAVCVPLVPDFVPVNALHVISLAILIPQNHQTLVLYCCLVC